jgi:biopolymer transport protein TolQ
MEPVNTQLNLDLFSIFVRSYETSQVSFLVLMSLTMLSIFSWGLIISKWSSLSKAKKANSQFVKIFWESRSLKELNSQLSTFSPSNIKEVFKSGYSELLRSRPGKDQGVGKDSNSMLLNTLTRALKKNSQRERLALSKNLALLAVIASVSPFIGLFGTVWGIISAFEGIYKLGNTSLVAVAPGISEALVATAFGLFCAIPALLFYNLFNQRIRSICFEMDGFCVDFLNIIERHYVQDQQKPQSPMSPSQGEFA